MVSYESSEEMQSRQVVIDNPPLIDRPVMLERLGWPYRLPVAFFFGCILGLSSPGFEFHWLAWMALAPLLVLVRGCTSVVAAALTGLCFGLGYYGVGLSWYIGLAPLTWLGLHEIVGTQVAFFIWIFEAFHQSLLLVMFSALIYCLPLRPGFLPHFRRPFFPHLIAIPIIWIFLSWIVAPSELFIGLPVNQLAYSQYKQLPLIQIASFGGSGAIDFLIVMCNAGIANLLLEFSRLAYGLGTRTDRIKTKVGAVLDLAVVTAVVVGLTTWGTARIEVEQVRGEIASARATDSQTPPVSIAVIQGNVSIEEERLKVTKPREIADRYKDLCDNLGASILCLPEGVVKSTQMEPGYLLSILTELSEKQKKEVIIGSIETLKNGLVNAARLISPFGHKDSLYVKRRLVPLGESLPIGVLNRRIPAPVRERFPATREAFLAGDSTHLVKSGWGKIGLSIYIELIYPRLIAEEVRQGASLLVNMSNLAWFHNSYINKQLLAAGVLRAVENDRYLVIASNTGISAVIDPRGMVVSESLPGQRGVLLDTIQFLYRKTPYSRMWWL